MTSEDVFKHQRLVSKITKAILALDNSTEDDTLVDYKALYYALFNDITDVIRELENSGENGDVLAKLISLQQKSEDRFIEYP